MPEEGTTPERADRMVMLISLAETLIGEVDELSKDSGKQFVSLAKRARINRLLIVGAIGSVIIELALTAVLAVLGVSMVHNTQRIDALTQRLDLAQTVQRQKALCPLYQIFLDSKSPQGRAAAPDPKKYDHAFVVIADGYKVLACDQFIKGS